MSSLGVGWGRWGYVFHPEKKIRSNEVFVNGVMKMTGYTPYFYKISWSPYGTGKEILKSHSKALTKVTTANSVAR